MFITSLLSVSLENGCKSFILNCSYRWSATNPCGRTKGTSERCTVYVHQHGGDDVTRKPPILGDVHSRQARRSFQPGRDLSIKQQTAEQKVRDVSLFQKIINQCISYGLERNKYYWQPYNPLGWRSGLMVRVLDSRSSGPGSSPGRGHCVVFLRARHFTLTVPQVSLRWTSIPSSWE